MSVTPDVVSVLALHIKFYIQVVFLKRYIYIYIYIYIRDSQSFRTVLVIKCVLIVISISKMFVKL